MGDDMKFSVLASLFTWISKSKSSSQKRSKFRKFLDHFCTPSHYFSSLRLILPSLDRERASYGLKESTLALSLLDALGIARDSPDAQRLINWRKGGSSVKSAGNFSLVAADVLGRRQGSLSADLTVAELNSLLDRLAGAETRAEKTEVLGEIIRKTNWQEMKWIVMIVLKDLKLGISARSVFHEFHPDAEDLFNVTCDLRLVCERLRDRNVRHKRQDIEVGKAVRPQLAVRVANCAAAWKKLHGKEVIVECKFDGDRIQIHKNGAQVNFFSRNFFDHQEYEHGMKDMVVDNVLAERCILDGEMLVWDTSTNRFADFGSNQEIAKAAREGLESERQLCYVAFDILYVGDTSVIHQTLKERQELLRKVVRPVKGRLEILLPNGSSDDESLNSHRKPGEPCWSIVAKHVNEVEKFFKETIENRDEGIVLKDLGSKWEPGDRSGKWLKVKPDYVRAGSDLDVLIIGGYYGSGRRGGEVAQFLVGLAERPSPNTYPRRFVSFCRVGTGLSDEELDELVTKLKPYFKKYEYPKKLPPSFYQVTNHSKERPDVWVESPEKSVILAITSDIRTISSEVFAAPYSLRFPRIDRVRYDKPWHECLDVQSFMELVHSSNGTTQRTGPDDGGMALDKPKRAKASKGEGRKKLTLAVPSHLALTDVSNVKGESQILSNMVLHFVNVPSGHSLDSLHKLVVENGGTFSMNLNDKVTHCVGAESKGIKYVAAKRQGCDIIHYSWLLDCCSQKQLLPLRPKHFVFLSDSSKKKLQEEIDQFSDSYFWDLNVAELKQILCNVDRFKDVKIVDYYKKKYTPREKWGRFHGCLFYFHLLVKPHSSDLEVLVKLALRRVKVQVSVCGGKVVDNPSQATHVIVMSIPGHELSFESLLQSFPENQKHVLRRIRLHVIGSRWLEDCLREEQKLPEEKYSLKPNALEGSTLEEEEEEDEDEEEEDKNNIVYQIDSALPSSHNEKPTKPVPTITSKTLPLIREARRKRGKVAVTKTPKTKRARIGKRPAKLEVASDDETNKEESNPDVTSDHEMDDRVLKESTIDEKPRKKRGKAVVHKPPTTKRARIGKKPARLQEIASDEETSKEEDKDTYKSGIPSPKVEMHDHVFSDLDTYTLGSFGSEFDNSRICAKSSATDGSDVYKQEELKSGAQGEEGQCSYNVAQFSFSKLDKDGDHSTSGKLEIMMDPVQTMLLNMIPSLGVKKSEDADPILETKNLSPTPPKEAPTVRPEGGPVQKKKKVSYKDLVAKSLLEED